MSSPGQQLATLFERLGEQIGRRYASNFAPRAPAPVAAPKPKAAAKAKAKAKPARPPSRQRRAAPKLRAPGEKIPKLRPAERIAPGRKVWYRQGRGAFEAEIIRVNADAGTVVLQRIVDLQRVIRPREKVFRPR